MAVAVLAAMVELAAALAEAATVAAAGWEGITRDPRGARDASTRIVGVA